MIFTAAASAQVQEQGMMERIMNPDRERANPMGAKAFGSKPFAGREFAAARGYGGVKPARTRDFVTREFLGIRNPWFGKKVFATREAGDINRYLLADRGYASRPVETRAVRDSGRAARTESETGADTARQFLGRGKSQEAINQSYPSGGPLTVEQVRELLNKPR
jgi:hypothetical protein